MNRRESLPAPKPQEILNRGRIVYIKHPAQDRLLFSFPALSTDSTGNHYGVFHPLVLDACRILTNRAASSQGDIDSDFLATDIEGHNRVSINITYLDVDFYYFLGPPEDEINRNYPIVKTLSAFTFPTVLPDRWAKIADAWRQQRSDPERPPATASQMSAIVERRDRKCALTRWRDCTSLYLMVTIAVQPSSSRGLHAPAGTQCAHLIPAAEEDWFVTDDMAELISEELFPGIHHPANGVLLRADVRMCFDAHSFVFYPDTDNDRADDRRFVAYIVQGGYADMPELLHRRPATIHPDVLVEFVYARFAYAIINLPRRNAFFASVEESDMLKIVRENRLEFEEERMSRDRDDGSDESDTDTDNRAYDCI